jgi:hypothetical protein
MFSSLKKTGMEEAEQVIGAWLDVDNNLTQPANQSPPFPERGPGG